MHTTEPSNISNEKRRASYSQHYSSPSGLFKLFSLSLDSAISYHVFIRGESYGKADLAKARFAHYAVYVMTPCPSVPVAYADHVGIIVGE